MSKTKQRNLNNHTLIYKWADYFCAMIAWGSFFAYRKMMIEKEENVSVIFQDINFWYGLIIIPIGWFLVYSLFDQYGDIHRHSRLKTLSRTFFLSFFGVLILFFTLILDDFVSNYTTYYQSFLALFSFHFILTVVTRMFLLTAASRRIRQGMVKFNTIIIGGNSEALTLYEEIISQKRSYGYHFIGFLRSNKEKTSPLETKLKYLGNIKDLDSIIKEYQIEEVIIAIQTQEHNLLKQLITALFDFRPILYVKIIPDMYDIMLGSVKMNQVFGTALIEINQEIMPPWQIAFKRVLDILVSFVSLLLLAPLFAYLSLKVKQSSIGPVFYRQERIGLRGVPFTILKFRSMYENAENSGPQLSKDEDNRCTPFGAIMRKWRLDELPQFWNVLIGEMSLVGPRPERKFYIDKIMEQAPHYRHLLKVRPGITSWGQVKYGYASDVDQMIQRLKYDILYLENRSIALDFKIMFYTLVVLVQGTGK
ncbi:MAG: sugar transferase [Bacteroidota bacterium]|jgi:exopolysaccharide biosynthesis polyprenyl glycosylphosphotransferase